jgi:hypothetical protein
MRKALLGSLLVGVLAIGTIEGAAMAQEPTSSPEQSTEQAKKLFEQARQLIESKQYEPAIRVLDSVLQLEPRSIGAHINLGDCYEKTNKPVKAWHHFNQARDLAEKRKDDRATVAKQRADALEPKLPKVSVAAPAPGLSISVNGEVLPQERWNKGLMQAPGRKDIVASAPGYLSWTTQVNVTDDGQPGEVAVPALEQDTSKGRGQRTVGVIVGGVGLAGVTLGAIFGIVALGKASDAKDCAQSGPGPTGCAEPDPTRTTKLDSLKDDAKGGPATISTIGFIAGGALLVGGIVLYLTAPKGNVEAGPAASKNDKPFKLQDVSLVPTAGAGNTGLVLSGRW